MRADLFTVPVDGPGRLSTMARPRGGDWLADEMVALRDAGVDVLVCMLTHQEMHELGLNEEARAAESAGLQFVRLPTPDRGVPEPGPFRTLVSQLVAALAGGRHVAVHCRMGIGRSSMVAAAVLMEQGEDAAEAWAVIAAARGLPVPDTDEQRRWVERAV
jgi:protein-tyrosine phosphatase